jgi:hypothetical protein
MVGGIDFLDCKYYLRCVRFVNSTNYKMTDEQYIGIWRKLTYGQKSPNPSREEIEIFTKDFQGVKDIPPKQDVAPYLGLN